MARWAVIWLFYLILLNDHGNLLILSWKIVNRKNWRVTSEYFVQFFFLMVSFTVWWQKGLGACLICHYKLLLISTHHLLWGCLFYLLLHFCIQEGRLLMLKTEAPWQFLDHLLPLWHWLGHPPTGMRTLIKLCITQIAPRFQAWHLLFLHWQYHGHILCWECSQHEQPFPVPPMELQGLMADFICAFIFVLSVWR